MYTSLMWIALAGSANVAARPAAPSWQTDYSAAQKRGAEEKKPLAVVIGRGETGWEALARDGKLDPSVAELLQSQYVPVYIDASTERGRKLADAFEMKNGLVLSNRGGDNQAFRHEGSLSNGDLERVLRRYADPERVVRSTETHGQPEVRYYPYDAAPAPVYAPSFAPSFAPASMGRGCSS